MLNALMNRTLPAMYKLLGEDAVHTNAAGVVDPLPKRIIFDKNGTAGLDGMQQTLEPTVRVQVAQFLTGLHRGDTLQIQGAAWRVRETALPMHDGKELGAPLAIVAAMATV